MKGDFTGDLRRRMEEACLLPAIKSDPLGDPTHRRLLDDIASAGDWATAEWAELHRENERLRVMLRDVPTPEGLESRLLDIPATARMASRSFRGWLGLAAAVFLLVGLGAVVMQWRSVSITNNSIAHVAALVAHDHESHPELVVETSDPVEAIRSLQPQAPFDIRLAGAPAGAELVGARICTFAEGPLVYSRWRGQDGEFSLYQIRLADFDLPQDLPERVVQSGSGQDAGRCHIRVWTDNQFAYAIVHDASPQQQSP